LLPINQNQALFSLIGTTYGGNGTTNFALPNLAGRAIVGTDNQAGSPAAGTVLGSETIAITSAMISSLNLNGTPNADALYGGDSADILNGLASDDRLTGNAGADQLNGGLGNDTASYQFNTGAVYAELNINKVFESALTAGTVLGNTAFQSQDILSSIENVVGSNFGDRLYGDALDNVISPGGGNDIAYAGSGIDTLDYAAAAGAVYADLSISTVIETALTAGTVLATTPLSSTDYALEFENLNGSSFGDRLYGTTGVNVINGNAGNDYIYGGAGADILNGGDGSDRLVGEAGADVLTGGANDDWFLFSTAPEAAVDTITDFAVGVDKLYIYRTAFGIGAAVPVNLVINGPATAASATFLYNSATGLLGFDADGSGAGAAVDFVNIGSGLALTVADVVLY
jgi:serralysin